MIERILSMKQLMQTISYITHYAIHNIHPEKIQRHLERKPAAESSENIDTSQKRTKRGDFAPFDFSVHCFICGDIWSVIMNKKHPDRREKKLWYTVQDSRSWKQ